MSVAMVFLWSNFTKPWSQQPCTFKQNYFGGRCKIDFCTKWAQYTLKDKLNWPVLHLQYLQDKKNPRPTNFFWSSHKQKITCRQWFENFYPVSNSSVSHLLKTHYLLYLPQEARENSKTNFGWMRTFWPYKKTWIVFLVMFIFASE